MGGFAAFVIAGFAAGCRTISVCWISEPLAMMTLRPSSVLRTVKPSATSSTTPVSHWAGVGRRHLDAVALLEGFVEHQADSADEVAERSLRGEADDHAHQAGPGEDRGADLVQRRDEMGIKGDQEQPQEEDQQAADELQGDLVDPLRLVMDQRVFQQTTDEPRQDQPDQDDRRAVDGGADRCGWIDDGRNAAFHEKSPVRPIAIDPDERASTVR